MGLVWFSRNRLKYSVNEKFFDVWTSQMAYILGFTYADGNIYKTSLAWDLQKRDVDILKKIKKSMNSAYPIILRKNSVRLRMNNQVLTEGAITRGLLPKKNVRDEIPKIPNELLRHFVRGYLEGDGWVLVRFDRNEGNVGFANGNKMFLELINKIVVDNLSIYSGKVRKKTKVTPRGVTAITYQLEFYSSNSFKLAQWVYENLDEKDLFLDRKYNNYLRMKSLYTFLNSGTKKARIIQRNFGRTIKEILEDLYLNQKLGSKMIAEILSVHSSSVNRWLLETGIRYSESVS